VVFVASADGSNAVVIPGVTGERLAWSPDGDRLAVGKRFGDIDPNVSIVTVATGHIEPLTLGSGLRPNAATWSPDGTRLLVEVPGNGSGSGIFSTRPDGSDAKLVVAPVADRYGWVRDASFSPDGRRIVFARADGGPSEIWIANADGSGAKVLAGGPGSFKVEPAWAPSGNFVACSIQSGTGRYDIAVLPLDGRDPWLVTEGLPWGGTHPTW
jgi:TolB protein